MSYEETYRRWSQDPVQFWHEAAQAIDWDHPYDQVLDAGDISRPTWFGGGMLNTCYNALDRHVFAGRGNHIALAYESPVTETSSTYTYAQLLEQVARFAGVLAGFGVGVGDRVVIYMPQIPEAVIAMLACARLGAVHVVVFGGFASRELAVRIEHAQAKVVVSASGGIEPQRVVPYKPMLDEALAMANHRPTACILFQRPQMPPLELTSGRDHDWAEQIAAAQPAACVSVRSVDPLYILYTSGTTGAPKGVVRDNGGHAVSLHWSTKAVYGMGPDDCFWASSDLGWAVGHSYTVYGPLLQGGSTVLYEGKPVGTPDAGSFWRVIEKHRVGALFTAPTAFRAIRREDPDGDFIRSADLSAFRTLFLAGEKLDTETQRWAMDQLKVPVVNHWWQTESGWPIASNCAGLGLVPVKLGSLARAVPGWDVQVLNDRGHGVANGQSGTIALKLPLPPGALTTLWLDPKRYQEAYFEDFAGYYTTNDSGMIDEDGHVYVFGRTDDVINVAGHRFATGAFEEVLAEHQDVAECAVVGLSDDLKGSVPAAFVVLNLGTGQELHERISKELIQSVRDKIGPVGAFRLVFFVERLPKTRSGKILRGTIRAMAQGQDAPVPATIEDPAVLDEIASVLRSVTKEFVDKPVPA